MDKILICGPRGVGKSTLIRRLTALYPGPVSGFVTAVSAVPWSLMTGAPGCWRGRACC